MARTGLLVDYGGVLTGSLGRAFARVEARAGLEEGALLRVVQDAYDGHDGGVVGRVERGEAEPGDLREALVGALGTGDVDTDPRSVLEGLGDAFAPFGAFWDVVAQAHAAGVRTAMLSNSWGVDGYPRERLDAIFDTLVISGEVGLRKPDPAIFRLAADRLGLDVEACVFVDDLDRNVNAAAELGMHGVLYRHSELEAVVGELRAVLGVDLEVPKVGGEDARSGPDGR